MSIGRFLGMVGALIWSPINRKYLILKRSPEKDFAGNFWECGTGRVDQGEGFTQALLREIKEEIGISVNIDFIIGTTHFYRGEKIPENEMIGVFYFCTTDEPDKIQMSWEHSTYRWVTVEQAQELFDEEFWLLRLIKRGELMRTLMPEKLICYYQEHGIDV